MPGELIPKKRIENDDTGGNDVTAPGIFEFAYECFRGHGMPAYKAFIII